ncbi:hypothetical protein [Defluviimonas salinarum]|uniref:Uncharacterized protein n=1 Tax=Defluviimonas salinarum TaxID=2992147 RepID=A0ABT3J640_9RHOB|nr:hypothetical protein [Defluviimonas salinarum]MCW3782920.1 hypothetical protein [Defluviimonas salinarum]
MKKRLHVSTDPTDPDARETCWRVGAIHRCCERYGKDRDWAREKLSEFLGEYYGERLSTIWFSNRHMEQSRERYAEHLEERRHLVAAAETACPAP